jgi:hypothetical protein
MAQAQLPRVQYDLIRLGGGLDQVTPTLTLPPGFARKAANFECNVSGGYTRIAGYERFDGRPSPSAALYNILICTFTGVVAVGDTVTGMTSAATGKVFAVTDTTVVVTRQVGNFVVNEGLSVSAVQKATVTGIQGVSADGLTDAQYRNLAADDYRADIQAVPGSGKVLGVVIYKGDVYAWRNAIGGASAAMFKATTSGWTQVTLGKELVFTNGVVDIPEGSTVTGQTSGATGVVARTVLQAGSWGGTTLASGRLILSSTTGTFTTGENLRIGSTVHAHAGGAATQITLLPNGRYETAIGNFGGGDANFRVYGCDGVNRAFEFDGTVFVPIATTMPNDVPLHVSVHKQHLFLSFGASLQFSALGYPYQWDPVLGAGEIAMNGQITNLIVLPGDQTSGALGVYTRRDTSVLYGTSEANFSLSTFNTGTGAVPYTARNMDQAYVLDDRGIISLGTTLNFGNFLPASLTMNLRPYLESRINLATASSLNRNKGQYRVFFSDGTGVYMTMINGKLIGSMPVEFLDPVVCCDEGEDVNGVAVSFFGSDNGFVYELDKGTSFDGDIISASVNLVYNSVKSPRILKRYRKASVELAGNYYTEIQFGYDLGYRRSEIPQPLDATFESDLRSSYWDSMIWDNFVWDGSDVTPSEIEVSGTAENIAIRVSCASDLFEPFTVNTIIIHYTMRRGLR